MHKSTKKRLIEIVDFAQGELKDLQVYQNLEYKVYLKNKDTRRLIERMIENISNAIIDILKILISEQRLDMPDSYAEIMEKGGSLYKLSETQIKNLIQVAKLRNILAHEYLDLKWDRIKSFLKEHQSTLKVVFEQTGTLITKDIKSEKAS